MSLAQLQTKASCCQGAWVFPLLSRKGWLAVRARQPLGFSVLGIPECLTP